MKVFVVSRLLSIALLLSLLSPWVTSPDDAGDEGADGGSGTSDGDSDGSEDDDSDGIPNTYDPFPDDETKPSNSFAPVVDPHTSSALFTMLPAAP